MGKNLYAAKIISEWETETTLMNAGTGHLACSDCWD